MGELRRAREMAISILNECAETKTLTPFQIWVFVLLAKITSSARSIDILAQHRLVGDCFMIIRSMHDSQVAIEYLLNGSRWHKDLLDLFRIEIAVEQYEELQFLAAYHDVDINEAVRQIKDGQRRVDRYKQATRHRAFNAKANDWPKRWRRISVDEMYKDIGIEKRNPLPKYMMTVLGNSFAHSGPISVQHFFELKNGSPAFRCGAFKHQFYTPRLMRRLATAVVLVACETVADHYHLSDRAKRRLLKLGLAVLPSHFKESKWRV